MQIPMIDFIQDVCILHKSSALYNTWKGGGGTEKDRGTREGEGKRESDKNDSRAMG